MTARQLAAIHRDNVLRRVLAGRKRVEVGNWKWDHPQRIVTVDRVPLPPQRVPLSRQRVEHAVLSFADYINTTQPSAERKPRR